VTASLGHGCRSDIFDAVRRRPTACEIPDPRDTDLAWFHAAAISRIAMAFLDDLESTDLTGE
jgi:hypothetical protein